MDKIKTHSKDAALRAYLSIVDNILSEHGRRPLACEHEITLASNMFRSRKSYIDCVITVILLRQSCEYQPKASRPQKD